MTDAEREKVKDLMQTLLNKCYQIVKIKKVWQVRETDGTIIMESTDYSACFEYVSTWEAEKCAFLGKWF